MSDTFTVEAWTARVTARETHVGIIGLGYVGLPLALLFSESGFRVTGFDIDAAKVETLNAGGSYIHRIEPAAIAAAIAAGFRATTMIAELHDCDAVLLCVPTPLGEGHEPDMRFIAGTVEALAPHTRSGQLIVLESTTWPGTTTELVVPTLERLGPCKVQGAGPRAQGPEDPLAGPCTLDPGSCLLVAFSPEREDPGNTTTPRRAIPKVVGGVSTDASAAAAALYGAIFERTVQMKTSTEASILRS
jgi:UDP-N-acetyl-D-glucosamine dehydrogenase